MTFALILLAALLYFGVTAAIWRSPRRHRPFEPALAAAALLLHALGLAQQTLQGSALSIGVNEALSLFTLQSAALLWFITWRQPVRPLGLVLYPLAAVCALWAARFPTPSHVAALSDWKTAAHVVISLLSAGLLTLAAVQAGALALQDRLLHRHEYGRLLLRGMPPLQTMESLLFHLLAIGFFLLSLTLLSGLWFIHDWFAQHLAHKTVLSLTAWLMFGVLLWGRWRHGWRGRMAIRWVLGSYGVLILAYFGTKLVLEQILGAHWT